jgi:hypothetical protein
LKTVFAVNGIKKNIVARYKKWCKQHSIKSYQALEIILTNAMDNPTTTLLMVERNLLVQEKTECVQQ